MTANWRHGWFLDSAPLVAAKSSGGTGSAGKYYFEVKLTTTNGFATGSGVFGICNSGANLARIVDVNVNVAQAQTAGAIVWTGDPNGGNNAWGYPTKLTLGGPGQWNLDEIFGVAIDTVNKLVWVRKPSGVWVGNGNPSPDPVTGAEGVDFASADHPVTGNIYAFAGGTNTNPASYGGVTLNFGATAFSIAAPTGFSAWGASEILNPADNSNLTLSGGNLVADAASAITGTNGPAAIVRSRGRKAQS